MKKIKTFFKKYDWLERAIKTFIQAFLGTLATSVSFGFSDFEEAKTYYITLIGSAAAAGISAVWNVLREHFNKEEEYE